MQYEFDNQGRMSLERQTVQHPETGELLWQHTTKHVSIISIGCHTEIMFMDADTLNAFNTALIHFEKNICVIILCL